MDKAPDFIDQPYYKRKYRYVRKKNIYNGYILFYVFFYLKKEFKIFSNNHE